jgi:hypothetical protein
MTFDDDLQRAFALLADRLRDEISRELQATAAVLAVSAVRDREQLVAEARAAEAAERPEPAADTDSPSAADLLEHIAAIDRGRSLTETLDALAVAAAFCAPRVAVLLAQGPQLRGWRFIGFGDGFEEPGRIELRRTDAGIIGEAAESGNAISARDGGLQVPSFATGPQGGRVFACPLVVGGETVAVLYADDGMAGGRDQGQGGDRPDLEILCRFTSRKLEAVAALKTARHLNGHAAEPTPAGQSQTTVDPQSDEDAAARRYAKLLVSEIKLYHEKDVADGRRDRDLMSRLGGEISHARAMYEQRVAAHVRARADHFQDELVRTLAGGDPTLVELEPERWTENPVR